MSARFLFLLLLLAALVTGLSLLYTAETQETLSAPEMEDFIRTATVHGWPWGYYAEVMELARVDERSVAVIEYTEVRWQKLGQTYLVWFLACMTLVSTLIVATDPRRRRG